MLSFDVAAHQTNWASKSAFGRNTAKPVLAVSPSFPINAKEPLPGRTVPTIVSPGRTTRRALPGASLYSYVSIFSIAPRLVFDKST